MLFRSECPGHDEIGKPDCVNVVHQPWCRHHKPHPVATSGPVEREARLQRSDAPRLLLMAAFGAVLGPVALAWGLQHTSGASASLMLTLEALFEAQEVDARRSTGMVYWEGAARLGDSRGRQLGLGYLEMTGYGERIRVG